MLGKYSKNDLQNRNDSAQEKDRLRAIYDDLVSRGKAGIQLSAIEQAHVYSGVNFLQQNINDFPFVEEARFKQLYLTYFRGLDGGGVYTKVRNMGIIRVPNDERDIDLAYLENEADEWEKLVSPGGLAEPLLQAAATHAKADRKQLDKSLNMPGNLYMTGTFLYAGKVRQTYLRSKFLYLMAKEILEETDPQDCRFMFCGEEIVFTEFSIIHILNGHYAEITKQYESGKDYHPEDFKPRILAKQIKEIMEEIDRSRLIQRQDKTEVNLRYNEQIYQFWAEWQEKFVKGHTGPVRYKQLQSFYPVSSQKVLNKLDNDYSEVPVSSELSVFVPNQP